MMETDEEEQQQHTNTGYENSVFISQIFDILIERGNLEFFMYALPGEPYAKLSEDVWFKLRKTAHTLQGIYAELAPEHWVSWFSDSLCITLFIVFFCYLHP